MTGNDTTAEVVTEEWCRVLEVAHPDPEDDFFTLGGNSLLAVTLVERVEQRLGISFPLESLFVEGTLGAVLAACAERVAQRATP